TAQSVIFRDFAHAPSKVKATIQATLHQFPGRRLIAVLELHTYSSLNKDFLGEYAGAMDKADVPVVYFSHHALELKRLPDLDPALIKAGFQNDRLVVISDKAALQAFLDTQSYQHTNLLLMSSGTYDGLDIAALKDKLH
ncbi:MAG TPA: peptidoglycan synthetase, partial [Chitinophaga sp.]